MTLFRESCTISSCLKVSATHMEVSNLSHWLRFPTLALALVLVALPLGQTALAGGLYLSEFATADMGTANAGSSARAGDAATAFANPAGMTYLGDHQAALGIAPGYGVIKFDQSSDTPVAGNNGGNQSGFIPLLSGAYVHKLTERIYFGTGLLSKSGAGLDPRNDWVGRNENQDVTLFTLSIVPTIGIKVTDWLSVGAGPIITYAKLDWQVEGPLFGGRIKAKDFDDVEAAAYVGALFQPRDNVRFGMTYKSETDLNLSGKIKNPLLEPVNAGLKLPLPHAIQGDLWWDVTQEVTLTIGAGWEDWSSAKQVPLSTNFGTAQVRLNTKDTWKLRGGAYYHLNPEWTFQTGVSYDSSPLDNKDRIAGLPLDEQVRFGIGATHQLSDSIQLSTAFQYVWLGDGKLKTGSVKGKFDDNSLFLVMFNVAWTKLPWSGKAMLPSKL
jgi:long-chain fatty acid transport protein